MGDNQRNIKQTKKQDTKGKSSHELIKRRRKKLGIHSENDWTKKKMAGTGIRGIAFIVDAG